MLSLNCGGYAAVYNRTCWEEMAAKVGSLCTQDMLRLGTLSYSMDILPSAWRMCLSRHYTSIMRLPLQPASMHASAYVVIRLLCS